MLGISKNTVKGIIREAAEKGDSMMPESDQKDWSSSIAWDVVKRELGTRYATIKSVHKDFAPEGVQYLKFWRELLRRLPPDMTDQARIRFQYKPGERVELDYYDGIPITDRSTGAVTKTHIFAGVSAYRDYTYGEFVMSPKKAEFLSSQIGCIIFLVGFFNM